MKEVVIGISAEQSGFSPKYVESTAFSPNIETHATRASSTRLHKQQGPRAKKKGNACRSKESRCKVKYIVVSDHPIDCRDGLALLIYTHAYFQTCICPLHRPTRDFHKLRMEFGWRNILGNVRKHREIFGEKNNANALSGRGVLPRSFEVQNPSAICKFLGKQGILTNKNSCFVPK